MVYNMRRNPSHIRRPSREGPDPESPTPRGIAELSRSALHTNIKILKDLAQDLALLPMIKADAYGHGAEWVAQELSGLPSLYGFGVATLEEGVRLRRGLGLRKRKIQILVFSGASPWTDEKGQLCETYGLTPVLFRDEDWNAFFKSGWPARINYELKFNTGMNRLGIHPEKALRILKDLRTSPLDWAPQGVLSHLALGEQPDHRLSTKQREKFKTLRGLFEAAFPSTRFHLGNSAALWNKRAWKLDELTDAVRPGISVYGVPPWKDAPARGLEAVMKLKSQIICVHDLKPGDTVGYGARFSVQSDPSCPRRIAIAASGYADGIHRMLSERGHALLRGRLEQVLGTISMDLSALSCSNQVRVGDYAIWLGPGLDPWKQSLAAGTIPYELLTSVSGRVQRVAVERHST